MRRPGPIGKALRGRAGGLVRGPVAGRGTGPTPPDSAANVGLLVTSALVPGTFAPSLSARSAADQGLVTGLSAGLHYLLTVGAQDTLQAVAAMLSRDPTLSRDPVLSGGAVLSREPALSRGPLLSRAPLLSPDAALSR